MMKYLLIALLVFAACTPKNTAKTETPAPAEGVSPGIDTDTAEGLYMFDNYSVITEQGAGAEDFLNFSPDTFIQLVQLAENQFSFISNYAPYEMYNPNKSAKHIELSSDEEPFFDFSFEKGAGNIDYAFFYSNDGGIILVIDYHLGDPVNEGETAAEQVLIIARFNKV